MAEPPEIGAGPGDRGVSEVGRSDEISMGTTPAFRRYFYSFLKKYGPPGPMRSIDRVTRPPQFHLHAVRDHTAPGGRFTTTGHSARSL